MEQTTAPVDRKPGSRPGRGGEVIVSIVGSMAHRAFPPPTIACSTTQNSPRQPPGRRCCPSQCAVFYPDPSHLPGRDGDDGRPVAGPGGPVAPRGSAGAGGSLPAADTGAEAGDRRARSIPGPDSTTGRSRTPPRSPQHGNVVDRREFPTAPPSCPARGTGQRRPIMAA